MSALGTHPHQGLHIARFMREHIAPTLAGHWAVFLICLFLLLFAVRWSRRNGLWSVSFKLWRLHFTRRAR